MLNEELKSYLLSFLSPRRQMLFEKVLNERTNHFTVVTQDVYQLHNTSAVIRSCDVFGIQNMHVIEERNLKKIDREIAMGAQKWVSLNRHHSTNECIEYLKSKDYQIVATSPHGAQDLKDFNVEKPSAIFFGTERHGLSPEVLEVADAAIKIPMVGFTESLNISVSAAIILQQLTTKLKESGVEWKLNKEEKSDVILEWLDKNLPNLDELIKNFQKL